MHGVNGAIAGISHCEAGHAIPAILCDITNFVIMTVDIHCLIAAAFAPRGLAGKRMLHSEQCLTSLLRLDLCFECVTAGAASALAAAGLSHGRRNSVFVIVVVIELSFRFAAHALPATAGTTLADEHLVDREICISK